MKSLVLCPFTSNSSSLKNPNRRLQKVSTIFLIGSLVHTPKKKDGYVWFILRLSWFTAPSLLKLGTESQHLWKYILDKAGVASRHGWSDGSGNTGEKFPELLLLNKGMTGRGSEETLINQLPLLEYNLSLRAARGREPLNFVLQI